MQCRKDKPQSPWNNTKQETEEKNTNLTHSRVSEMIMSVRVTGRRNFLEVDRKTRDHTKAVGTDLATNGAQTYEIHGN